MRSRLEDAFEFQLKSFFRDVHFTREYRWHPKRKWKADFCILKPQILIEIEGGNWSRGRHVRGKGFENDCEKYNEAALAGYTLLRGTARHVQNGQLLEWVERALKA